MTFRRLAVSALLIASGCENATHAVAGPPPPQAQSCRTAPVLLPADPALRGAATQRAVGVGHSVAARADGISLEITGLPHGGAPTPLAVQQTEYGFDASFARGCGLYNVSLSCERAADARCADERYIRRLAEGLR